MIAASATERSQRKPATYRALGRNQVGIRLLELADAQYAAGDENARDRAIGLVLRFQGAYILWRKRRLAYRERPSERTLARLTKAKRNLDRLITHLRIIVATESSAAASLPISEKREMKCE
ncbi:MAG TPA: hypothetical protein VGX94_12070 [Terriglobia bacterium]|nr:hypothetical protein [Terriglobia bacterium]